MEGDLRLNLGYAPAQTEAGRISQAFNSREPPGLPAPDIQVGRRCEGGPAWTPPETILLVRHRAADGSRRIVTNDRVPPDGFEIEYDLGIVHPHALPGMRCLISRNGSYFLNPFEDALDGEWRQLGYVQQSPLPMMELLELRAHRETGEHLLVCGPDDPLVGDAVPLAPLGYVDGFPPRPRQVVDAPITWHLVTLARSSDERRRRHRYRAVSRPSEGEVSLGGLLDVSKPGSIELRIGSAGWLETDDCPSPRQRQTFVGKIAWGASPLAWAGASAFPAIAERLYTLGWHRRRLSDSRTSPTVLGYLRREPAAGWSPLFSAQHPALDDQYVTRSALEATDMGYRIVGILGYAADSCAHRESDALPPVVKWASRFGVGRRYVEGPKHG